MRLTEYPTQAPFPVLDPILSIWPQALLFVFSLDPPPLTIENNKTNKVSKQMKGHFCELITQINT